MKPDSTVNGFVSGTGSVYREFWDTRFGDLRILPKEEQDEITDYLNQQVFGASVAGGDSYEDHDMQMAFNQKIRQQLSERATKKGQGEKGNRSQGGDKEEENEEDGQGGGSQGD